MPAQAHGVGSGYPVQELRESLSSRRTYDEMPVIGHHAVRDEFDRMSFQPLSQNREKAAIIIRSQKERRASHAAVGHVKVVFGA